MNSPKIGHKSKKKLIKQYNDTISKYTLENNQLQIKIEDIKTTLKLNQELLYHFISSKLGENEKIKDLIIKCKTLWASNESLIENKNNIEINTEKLERIMEVTPIQIKNEINNISIQNNKKKTDLVLKENTIKKLKNDLEKTRKNAFYKTPRIEVLVTEPSKLSLEKNQEIINIKSILLKASNRHSKEKKKSDKLEKELRNLINEMIKLKKKAINLNKKLDIKDSQLKESFKSINDEENNFLKNIGYVESVEKIEKEEEEEEEEDEESEESSEEDSEEKGRNTKAKTKEYESLNEQFNKLKSEFEDYKNKINEYKETYKNLKSKMQKLKNISIQKD